MNECAFIRVDDVRVSFRRGGHRVDALSGVSLTIERGEAVGIVGESGSGKTTLVRALLGLQQPSKGSVDFEGQSISERLRRDARTFRRRIQMVFQDPYGSLNPRMRVGSALAEVLRVHRLAQGGLVETAVFDLLRAVGLDAEYAGRYPHECSGGQRQRIALARALATRPDVLIADEPVSALDVSVQAQVLNLLKDLQRERGLTLVLVAHDLAAVRYLCDRVIVVQRGRIVEHGPAEAVLREPSHPYTQALLAAAPEI